MYISKRILVLGLLIVLALSATGWVVAQSDGVIHACANPVGLLRVVADSTSCLAKETPLQWNIQGQQGEPGPAGPAGEQGPPGAVPAATDSTGGGQAHNNMQPSLTLHCIIALQGIFPPRSIAEREGAEALTGAEAINSPEAITGMDPFIGEIAWVAFNFPPRGWAFCDGQLLPIAGNEALFSLLGTTYGGDGRTTFALPDARGRAIVHAGNGPGLTPRTWGSRFGTETETLTVPQMPAHVHSITAP